MMDPSTINGRTTAEAVITEIIGEEGIRLHKEIGFRLLLAAAETSLHSLRPLLWLMRIPRNGIAEDILVIFVDASVVSLAIGHYVFPAVLTLGHSLTLLF